MLHPQTKCMEVNTFLSKKKAIGHSHIVARVAQDKIADISQASHQTQIYHSSRQTQVIGHHQSP